jgi:hypothetical protein
LKDDSQFSFEANLKVLGSNPNTVALIPLTVGHHGKESLCAVMPIVFPYHTLETQIGIPQRYVLIEHCGIAEHILQSCGIAAEHVMQSCLL